MYIKQLFAPNTALNSLAIDLLLTQKFKSMQHGSGVPVWLLKGADVNGMTTALYTAFKAKAEHHYAFKPLSCLKRVERPLNDIDS